MWFKNINPSELKVKHNVLSWDDNMHTMNKNSWHYKLAVSGKDGWELERFEENCDNFCKYARSVVRGAFRYFAATMGILLIASFVLYVLGDSIAWIFWMIYNWSLVEPSIGAQVMIVIASLCMMFGAFALIQKGWRYSADAIAIAAHKTADNVSKRETGFIALLYKKYKEKVCFGVDYE